MPRVSDRIFAVVNRESSWEPHLLGEPSVPNRTSERAIVEIRRGTDGKIAVEMLDHDVGGDADLEAYFGFGGRRTAADVGLLAVHRREGTWRIFHEGSYLELTPPD